MEKEEFVHLFSKRIDKLERTFKEKFPDGIDDRTTATIPLGFMNRLVIDGRQYMDILSNLKDDEKINYYYFIQKLKDLLNANIHFKLTEFAIKNLELVDSFVFFDTILDAMNCGENDFNTSLQSTVDDFYERKRDSFKYINNFLEEKTTLNLLDLIEKDSNSFSNRHRIQLTQKAVSMLK